MNIGLSDILQNPIIKNIAGLFSQPAPSPAVQGAQAVTGGPQLGPQAMLQAETPDIPQPSSYDKAWEYWVQNEGRGKVQDIGGRAMYGIHEKYNPAFWDRVDKMQEIYGKVDPVVLENMSKAHMFDKYWKGNNLHKIANEGLAIKLFDNIGHVGSKRAVKFLQNAINKLGGTDLRNKKLVVDGKLGARTLQGINSVNPDQLLQALVKEQVTFFKEKETTPRTEKYMKGWLNRAKRLPFNMAAKEIQYPPKKAPKYPPAKVPRQYDWGKLESLPKPSYPRPKEEYLRGPFQI